MAQEEAENDGSVIDLDPFILVFVHLLQSIDVFLSIMAKSAILFFLASVVVATLPFHSLQDFVDFFNILHHMLLLILFLFLVVTHVLDLVLGGRQFGGG